MATDLLREINFHSLNIISQKILRNYLEKSKNVLAKQEIFHQFNVGRNKIFYANSTKLKKNFLVAFKEPLKVLFPHCNHKTYLQVLNKRKFENSPFLNLHFKCTECQPRIRTLILLLESPLKEANEIQFLVVQYKKEDHMLSKIKVNETKNNMKNEKSNYAIEKSVLNRPITKNLDFEITIPKEKNIKTKRVKRKSFNNDESLSTTFDTKFQFINSNIKHYLENDEIYCKLDSYCQNVVEKFVKRSRKKLNTKLKLHLIHFEKDQIPDLESSTRKIRKKWYSLIQKNLKEIFPSCEHHVKFARQPKVREKFVYPYPIYTIYFCCPKCEPKLTPCLLLKSPKYVQENIPMIIIQFGDVEHSVIPSKSDLSSAKIVRPSKKTNSSNNQEECNLKTSNFDISNNHRRVISRSFVKKKTATQDPRVDIYYLQESLNALFNGFENFGIKGYIQLYEVNPFKIIMTSLRQLQLFHSLKTKIIYFDYFNALDNGIQNDFSSYLGSYCSDKLHYFAFVFKFETSNSENEEIIPIFEVLSSNNNFDVKEMLLRLKHYYFEANLTELDVETIVMKYDYDILNTTSLVLCNQTIEKHAYCAWKYKKPIKVYICQTNMLNQFSTLLFKYFPKLESRQRKMIEVFLEKILSSTSEEKLVENFKNLCKVLLSKYKSDCVIKYLFGNIDYFDELEFNYYFNYFKSESEFNFESLAKLIEKSIENEIVEEIQLNEFYCPPFVDKLVADYMSLIPLWSEIQRPSLNNAVVDEWFKTIKYDLLKNKCVSPAKFIETLHGRVSSITIKTIKKDYLEAKGDQTEENHQFSNFEISQDFEMEDKWPDSLEDIEFKDDLFECREEYFVDDCELDYLEKEEFMNEDITKKCKVKKKSKKKKFLTLEVVD